MVSTVTLVLFDVVVGAVVWAAASPMGNPANSIVKPTNSDISRRLCMTVHSFSYYMLAVATHCDADVLLPLEHIATRATSCEPIWSLL